ncbi:MAG: type II toxin-antitoxin system HicA family toxin [Proteobacteria bacterium]|nr:type II toxin-antitoxin system HicA family toxin [Pseudomonadota bacterium]
MNSKQRKTLEAVFALPPNGNLSWTQIESLLKALGCRTVEGAGSSVTFEHQGCRVTFHRPHPGKEALRYRVLAAREFIARIGKQP